MHDPERLRDLARKCREHAKSTVDPEAIEQLRRWAVELADEADKAEWNANHPGDPDIVRTLFEVEDE
jgi:hypothetical protein